MSNDSNLKTLIEDLQKRVDFIEKHHEMILDRIGFIEDLLNIDAEPPDSELYNPEKEIR